MECGKGFVQGGRADLARYHLLLEQRVKALKLPQDVAAEVLHQAAQDVIEGKGYCWTVELHTAAAFRECRGTWGLGSDHPAYREANGQDKYAD